MMKRMRLYAIAILAMMVLSVGSAHAQKKDSPPNDPAQNAFQADLRLQFFPNQTFAEGEVIAVPAGKRLVIEYISADIHMPVGQLPGLSLIIDNVNAAGTPTNVGHSLPTQSQGTYAMWGQNWQRFVASIRRSSCSSSSTTASLRAAGRFPVSRWSTSPSRAAI